MNDSKLLDPDRFANGLKKWLTKKRLLRNEHS